MLFIYNIITRFSAPVLIFLLKKRVKMGKEDPERVIEKRGLSTIARPDGHIIWIHAASVGEAQSALILIDRLLEAYPAIHVLITTGTVTSADLMARRLPLRAIHQFCPLDHPKWIKSFIAYWKPSAALWLESELWPNMLGLIKKKKIPAILINARLSDSSFRRWQFFKGTAKTILSAFKIILTQTQKDQRRFEKLDAKTVHHVGNIKQCALPLPYDENGYNALIKAIGARPFWVYASTHDGEEKLAARVHHTLKQHFTDILTIIVPRHPERRDALKKQLGCERLILRGADKAMPSVKDEIYVADTFGELGLFYKAAPIAMIGRSFSDDGGGGHNPLEAAQLHCAVLTGPNVQYQQEIFDDMIEAHAVRRVQDEQELVQALTTLLGDETVLKKAQENAFEYTQRQLSMIDDVMGHITPLLNKVMKK